MGDGSVRVVGDLDGDGTIDLTPTTVDMGCPARSIAVGAGSLAAVCGDGSVMVAKSIINTSRSNIKGQRVAGLSSVKAVNLGRPGLLALRSDGTVWFADKGINEAGFAAAVQVSGLSDVVAIATGIDDAVAVHADGTASRMAINTKGIPSKRIAGLPPVKGVSVCGPDDDCDGTDGYYYVAGNGSLSTFLTAPDGTSQLVTVGGPVCNPCSAAGHDRVLFLSASGTLQMATVDVTSGNVTVQNSSWTVAPPKQVAAGRSLDMALAADGTVWVWAAPQSLKQVVGLDGVREIAAGDDRACAVGGDGTVRCWGSNLAAKTFVLPHVLEVSHMSVTKDYWMALHTDGSISIGLWPAEGQLTAEPVIHRDVAARAAGSCCRGHVIIMKFDGTVEDASIAIDESGVHLSDFKPVQGLERIIQMAGTAFGYLAIRADGTVYTGRAGSPPAPVKELGGAVSAACSSTVCAVSMGDGSVRGIAIDEPGVHIWGDPHVDEADGSVAVSGGGGGSGGVIALRADGTVVSFGEKVSAGLVTDTVDAITVTANAQWNLLLRADGTVWRWRVGSL
jgi:hypothetical protein